MTKWYAEMGFALLEQHQQDQQQLSTAKTEASEAQSMVSMLVCVNKSLALQECSGCTCVVVRIIVHDVCH